MVRDKVEITAAEDAEKPLGYTVRSSVLCLETAAFAT